MKLVPKKVLWFFFATSVLPIPMYGMERLPSQEKSEESAPFTQDAQKFELSGVISCAPGVANRLVPILEQDQDGRILWGNIAAVAAFALVLGYAFAGV